MLGYMRRVLIVIIVLPFVIKSLIMKAVGFTIVKILQATWRNMMTYQLYGAMIGPWWWIVLPKNGWIIMDLCEVIYPVGAPKSPSYLRYITTHMIKFSKTRAEEKNPKVVVAKTTFATKGIPRPIRMCTDTVLNTRLNALRKAISEMELVME